MNLAASVLGSSTVEKLQQSAAAAVLQIGSDKLTRADLARIDCFNFIAAVRLSKVLHDELRVKDLRDVYNRVPPSALALPGVGVISLAVLGAAFEARGIGGDTPLENWVRKHARQDKQGEPQMRTFSTIKKHEQDEAARERKEKKARTTRRRGQAHELRIARFVQKTAS